MTVSNKKCFTETTVARDTKRFGDTVKDRTKWKIGNLTLLPMIIL